MTVADEERREVACNYSGPAWSSSDWIKNLILFFDGIALLVPRYLKHKPELIWIGELALRDRFGTGGVAKWHA